MAYNGVHYRTPGAGSGSTPVVNLTDINSSELKYILGVKYIGDNQPTPVLVGDINDSSSANKIAFTSDLVNKQDKLTASNNTIVIDGSNIKANYVGTNGVIVSGNSISCPDLADKQGKLNAADSTIVISGNNIKANYVGGTGISVSGNTISYTGGGEGPTYSNGKHITIDSDNKINADDVTRELVGSESESSAQCQRIKHGDTTVCYVPVSDIYGRTYSAEYYATSDRSLKENISKLEPNNDIFNVPIVGFNWKDTKIKSVGVIAQDLEKVAPIAVSTSDNGIKSVNYTAFLLLRIAALEKRISELEDKLK